MEDMGKQPGSEPSRKVGTRTAPEFLVEPHPNDPNLVAALRLYDMEIEYPFPVDAKILSVGSSPDREIPIDSPHVSGLHAVIERRHHKTVVRDQGSKNGTHHNGVRVDVFELSPGDSFLVGTTMLRLIALNDAMRLAYPTLFDILGGELANRGMVENVTPCAAFGLAVSGRHILITGDPSCGQDLLARTLHRISPRRDLPIVEIDGAQIPRTREKQRELHVACSRATALVTIATGARLDSEFVSGLFSPSFGAWVIVIAPSINDAVDALGITWVNHFSRIGLRRLAERKNVILSILDHGWEARGNSFRTSQLTEENRNKLVRHAWPNNLESLQLALERLPAIAEHGAFTKAADALGLGKSTVHNWFVNLELDLPLTQS
jgi:hypothetical protein